MSVLCFQGCLYCFLYQIQCIWFYVGDICLFGVFLCRVINMGLFALFYIETPNLTSTICWRCCLYSSVYFCVFYKSLGSIYVWNHVLASNSIPLISKSVFLPIQCCFYCYDFIVQLKIGARDTFHILSFMTVVVICCCCCCCYYSCLGFFLVSIWSWKLSLQILSRFVLKF